MIPKNSFVNNISIFLLGLVGLSLGYVLATTTYSLTFLYQGLELISLGLIFFALFRLISFKIEYSYFSLIAISYLLWQLIILIRGDFTDITYFDLKQLLFDLNYGGFVLLIPIVAFIPVKLIVLKKLFNATLLLSGLFLFLAILNFQTLLNPDLLDLDSLGMVEAYGKYFVFPIGLLAMNFDLLERKHRILVIVSLIAILCFGIFRARRGLIFMQLSVIVVSSIIFFYKTNRKLSISIFVLYIITLLFVYLSNSAEFLKLSFFTNISSRGLENTRQFVEGCFFNDMTRLDWIVGKGYNSGYRCPGIDDSIFKDGIRKVIETDYLQLIMVGGIINVILLLLIVLPAIYLGIFDSGSMVAKTLSVWICIWLLALYPANVYSLNLYHISVWICSGFCYSKSFRQLTQEEIRLYFLKEINLKRPSLK